MYEFTPEMVGEISGFGGGYEQACRDMLKAGLEFWSSQPPGFDPKFTTIRNVYGIVNDENEDAKALSDAVTAAVPDCTGAMHQAVVSTIVWIRHNGWGAYVEQMSRPKEEE